MGVKHTIMTWVCLKCGGNKYIENSLKLWITWNKRGTPIVVKIKADCM